jgi:hypothetical protein
MGLDYNAEYVALTQLQADSFVTLDADLARNMEGIVATASIDALCKEPTPGRECGAVSGFETLNRGLQAPRTVRGCPLAFYSFGASVLIRVENPGLRVPIAISVSLLRLVRSLD